MRIVAGSSAVYALMLRILEVFRRRRGSASIRTVLLKDRPHFNKCAEAAYRPDVSRISRATRIASSSAYKTVVELFEGSELFIAPPLDLILLNPFDAMLR